MPELNSPLLTPKQSEALLRGFESLDESQRSRFRDRIISVLQDFTTLSHLLPAEEREQLFRKAAGWDLNRNVQDEDREWEFKATLTHLQAFLWAGVRDIGWESEEYERILEDAIEETEEDFLILPADSYTVVEADVEIDVTRHYIRDPAESRERYRRGESLNPEEFKRALDPIPQEELVELLEKYNTDE